MTHDPREALEPCPFCNGEAEIHRRGDHRVSTIYRCTNCGCRLETGEEFSHGKRWNERAITASAPKAEPAADWSNLPKDIYVTGAERVDAVGFDVQCCSVPMVTAPEVRYVRADMISIKPLEWSGRSSNGKIHKAYVVPMEYWAWENAGFGYWSWGSLAGREVYGGIDGAKAAAQADYERRILSALSTTPAAAESNARAEARLRKLLTTVRSMHGELGAKFDEISKCMPNDHMAQAAARARQKGLGLAIEPIERTLKALSAVGDESQAKATEGKAGMAGVTDPVRRSTAGTGLRVGEASADLPATSEIMDATAGETATPSSPTAERREIVARECADELALIVEAAERVAKRTGNTFVLNRQRIAQMIASRFAALDGGAGA